MKTLSKSTINTAYDDVYRTLLNECKQLIIPLLNELFCEDYTGNEEIIFNPNELFIHQQDNKDEKRITDSSFTVNSAYGKKHYLCECQSNPDSSMLVRMYEYTFQSALREKVFTGDRLKVTIPYCAVLFLRSTESTPDQMTIEIETPKGSIEYTIEIMKVQRYTLEELFEKKLLFLLPYYIFKHESKFNEYNKDKDKLYDLQAECYKIVTQLESMLKTHEIDSYTKKVITEMFTKVTEKIAHNYQNVVKGVKYVMGGQVLEFEAKTIHDEGKELGRIEGRELGRIEERIKLAKAFLDLADDETIANKTGLSLKEVKALRKES